MKRAIQYIVLAILLCTLSTSCTMAPPTGSLDNNLLGTANRTQAPYTGMFSNGYTPVTSTPIPQGSLMFVDVDEANARRAEREERRNDPFLFIDIPEPIVIDKPTAPPTDPPLPDNVLIDTPLPPSPTPERRKTEPSTPIFSLCGSVETRYAYQQLTQSQKELFSQLYDGIVENECPIYIKGSYSYSDYLPVYRALDYDCPELFNIDWPMACYTYTINNTVSQVDPEYCMSNSEYIQRLEKVMGKIKGMASASGFGSTKVDHEIYIQRYLVENVTYVLQEDARRADRAYLDGYAKCDGYSNATMLALRYYGIPCLNVIGWTCEEDGSRADSLHQWNMVKLSGDWYHLDTTWNDTDGKVQFVMQAAQSKYVYYLPYMNISDTRMLYCRGIEQECHPWELPTANSNELSYYNLYGMYVSGVEAARSNLSSQLSNIAQYGGDFAIVYFERTSEQEAFVSSVESFLNSWRGWKNERLNGYYYRWFSNGLLYVYDFSFR